MDRGGAPIQKTLGAEIPVTLLSGCEVRKAIHARMQTEDRPLKLMQEQGELAFELLINKILFVQTTYTQSVTF